MEDIDAIDKENLLLKKDNFQKIYKELSKEINEVSFKSNKTTIAFTFDSQNPDPIEISFEIFNKLYRVSYWDGYAVNEYYDYKNFNKAFKKFSKFSSKALNNIDKFGIK